MLTFNNFKNTPIKWFYDTTINQAFDLIHKGLDISSLDINYNAIEVDNRLSIVRRKILLKLMKNDYFKEKPSMVLVKTVMFSPEPPRLQHMFVLDDGHVQIGDRVITRMQCWQLKWNCDISGFIDYIVSGSTVNLNPKYKSQELIDHEVSLVYGIKTDYLMNVHDDVPCAVVDCENKSCGMTRFTDGKFIYWIYVCNKHMMGKVKLKNTSNKFFQKIFNPQEDII